MKIRKQNLSKSLRTISSSKNFQDKKKSNVFRKDNDELLIKNCPKKKRTIIQQTKSKLPPKGPSFKRKTLLELDNVWFCQICQNIINKLKHQID